MATVPQPARLLDDSFLKFLPAPLREPRRAWLAILIGAAMTIAGSLALAVASKAIAPNLPTPAFPIKGPLALFLLVVFAPVLETLIMAGFLTLFLRFLPPASAILLSAAGWGIAHSLEALGWGLVIWWPFLIFSTLFVVWRQRGFWAGVGVAAATHALQNLGPGLKVAFG
ncbi:hypothetical protein LZ518_04250 [Sphingomonas sp. RB56-2]|uniref:CPBP family intramembrane metalloprotease n=1 Tax=Sphingomonas brevis TaxID=2908206 RepID=A0ABT0S7J4_9SPHN|nr:hypothetical protein [Sphingomonas brevis]MCL6740342.1 hypothetical protein [Sphingomonas brevis]